MDGGLFINDCALQRQFSKTQLITMSKLRTLTAVVPFLDISSDIPIITNEATGR